MIKSDGQIGIHVLATGQKEIMNSEIITLYQNATLYSVLGDAHNPTKIDLAPNRQMYLVICKGEVTINSESVGNRDGVFIKNEEEIEKHINLIEKEIEISKKNLRMLELKNWLNLIN